MKYLLDTDHLSIWQRRTGREYAAIERHFSTSAESEVALSAVSFHEQALAAHTFMSKGRDPKRIVLGYEILGRIIESFSLLTVVLFDDSALKTFHDFRAQRVRIGTMDLRIAATAVAHGLILVTRNRSDFAQAPGLVIEDWTT